MILGWLSTFKGHSQIPVLLMWQYWKNFAWHLQICNGRFAQVSESWPMGLPLVYFRPNYISFINADNYYHNKKVARQWKHFFSYMRTAKDQYILIRTILFCWTIFYSLNNSTSGSVYGPGQTVQKFKVVWALISHNYMTKPFSYGIALTNMDNNSIRNKKTQ